jgi:predicted DNA-binding protein (MmcQ/YjbR family)
MASPAELRSRLLDYALSLPEAQLEHPWGEDVAKVRRKVFVFFGTRTGMTVKLPSSQPLALAQPGVAPAGYGLGKSGWVDVNFSDELPYDMLREWILESYRAVAPRQLAAMLEDR